ncbi:MAG: CPBP family intramembrane metalloprotease [Bryobacteraceae bacterium]|nr:CPBP family intramembrane metalloprotease [Bryobacteraceae bacterium]
MMMVTFVPLVEECVFRGYLFLMLFAVGGAISSSWASAIAICGTAVLFAAAHSAGAWSAGQLLRIATTFTTGLIFATLRHRSASTVPGVVAHAVYNAGIVLLGSAVGQCM